MPRLSLEFHRIKFLKPGAAMSQLKNFNLIPFRSLRVAHYRIDFPHLLGWPNPCESVDHMEPFPVLAFKVLI